MGKYRRILALTLTTIVTLTTVGCNNPFKKVEKQDKGEVTNIENKISEENKEETTKINIKDSNEDINSKDEIVNLSKVDKVTKEMFDNQMYIRTIAILKDKYKLNYDLEDVKNYYLEQSNKNANQVLSKEDINTSIQSEIMIYGLDEYAKSHQIDFIKNKIININAKNILDSLSDSEKKEITDGALAFYSSLGMSASESDEAALNNYAANEALNGVNEEINSIQSDVKRDIFAEVNSGIYNKLPESRQDK